MSKLTPRHIPFLDNRGFSIYEIIAVVIILSVLLSLTIPEYTNLIRRGENQEAEQFLRAVWIAQQDFRLENGNFASNISQLDLDVNPLKNFVIFPQQQNIVCGGNSSNSLVHVHKVVNGDFEYEIVLLEDGRVSCFPCGTVCQRMGYDPF